MIDFISTLAQVEVSSNLHCESENFALKILGEKSAIEARVYCRGKALRIASLTKYLNANSTLFSTVKKTVGTMEFELTIYLEDKKIARCFPNNRSGLISKILGIENIQIDLGTLFNELVRQRRAEQRQNG